MPIAPHHRQFLRFAFQERAYQSKSLAPIQARGLTVLPCLDDWLVCPPNGGAGSQRHCCAPWACEPAGPHSQRLQEQSHTQSKGRLPWHDSRLTVNESLPFSEKGGEHFAPHRLLPERQSVEIRPLSQTAAYADSSIHGDPARSPFLTAPSDLGQHRQEAGASGYPALAV